MNCKQVRQYLYAFADGQIDVRANCEVLDHLKMCPPCSDVVGEQQALRDAIARSAARIKAPPSLEARVKLAILSGESPENARRAPAGRRVLKLVALAACLALTVIAAWQYGAREGAGWTVTPADPLAVANATREVASTVVIRHNKCVARCEKQIHQSETLPAEPNELPTALCGILGNNVFAVVPDLTPFNYEFESANICKFQGEEGANAGHLMYVNYQFGTRLSLFNMPHWSGIDIARVAAPDQPFINEMPGCTNNLSVVAWHSGETTFVLCGPLDVDDMREVAELVQAQIADRR